MQPKRDVWWRLARSRGLFLVIVVAFSTFIIQDILAARRMVEALGGEAWRITATVVPLMWYTASLTGLLLLRLLRHVWIKYKGRPPLFPGEVEEGKD